MTDISNATPFQGMAMPFISHLEELRWRIIACVITIGVTTTLTFFYTDPLIHLLQALAPKGTLFVQLSPGEVFLSSFKLSMLSGIGLALPVVLYHVFRFISPGLERHEKRSVMPLFGFGLILFCAGVVFGYYGVLPFMLDFLLGYGQSVARNQLSIATYLNFCVGFLFATGLVFQLPMVLLAAGFMNLITSDKLLKQWRWAIIVSFVVGAIITPSVDPFSQTFMSIALIGLYAISIVLMKVFRK